MRYDCLDDFMSDLPALALRARDALRGHDGLFSLSVEDRAWLIRLRYRLLDHLDQAFGENSALPKALLLGERDALREEDRAAFTDLGIAHVLAVSGLHISLIVAALSLLVRRFLSVRRQLWLFWAFLLVYVLLLDLRASVLRAAILTFSYLYVRARGRSSDPLSVLSLASLMRFTL